MNLDRIEAGYARADGVFAGNLTATRGWPYRCSRCRRGLASKPEEGMCGACTREVSMWARWEEQSRQQAAHNRTMRERRK